jgi:chorismate mutase/prephenate dehydratase
VSDTKREIDELRQEIAKLDAQLLAALDKRAKASKKIGELRKALPASLPLQDRAAIHALVARASEMPQESLRAILREVFAACVALELPVTVSYLGPEGGAGHAAARARFGASASLVAAESTAAALDEVMRKRAEYAVVPFETSTDGPVQTTIVALTQSDLRICEQLEHAFDLHIMNRTGNLGDVEKIYATPADHALCQIALDALCQPGTDGRAAKVGVLDIRTPMMACHIAVEDHGAAALATDVFGASVGLEIAKRNVVDRGSNRVRYAIVGARPSSRTGSDVTAFVFATHDAPGALLDALKQFAERGVNMTKIQSRPIQDQAWQYLFFVEVSGHFTDRALVSAFEDTKRVARFFKVLGSYPALT